MGFNEPSAGERRLLIESGRVMVSTNGGGPKTSSQRPSVTWVELASGKLLDRLELDTPLLNSGHVGLGDALVQR